MFRPAKFTLGSFPTDMACIPIETHKPLGSAEKCRGLAGCRWALAGFSRAAFSLIELLVVIAIISLLAVFTIPAISGIKGGSDVTSTAYSITGILDQARAYAMANNTYVWVGIAEVDVSVNSSTSPQVAGNGRVAIAVVASRDGTRGYDASSSNLSSPCWSNYNNGGNLIAINKLQYFDNMHVALPNILNGSGAAKDSSGMVGSGGMRRPGILSNSYVLSCEPSASSTSITPFSWPLGNALGSGQYQFNSVITFDPMGVPRIQMPSNQDGTVAYIEIGLIPTHGNSLPNTTPPNIAAIQIDGMTGATRIYRP